MNREIILAGRPNSGKSSLFNRLAKAQQKVANYAGCTVERKSSTLADIDEEIEITDLPGVYSLKANTKDEEVALKHLEQRREQSKVLVVADGNNLEQELAFPLILRRLGHDIAIAVNMMDEVEANKRILNLKGMEEMAGIPIFPVSARTGDGVKALKNYLVRESRFAQDSRTAEPATAEKANNDTAFLEFLRTARGEANRIYQPNSKEPIKDALIERSERLDQFLVHPVFGPLFFFGVMFLLFQSVFTWSGPLSDLIEAGLGVLQDYSRSHITNEFVASLLSDGVIAGVGAVLTFVPQIGILFTLIGILELSGYLPRAAYMVDKLLRPYGLEGKVFIPLLSSVACAVPGIMSARTIENERTRLITIMISPLMTCSARLPVYTLLIGSFIPAQRVFGFLSLPGLVMFAMYVLGAAMALIVAFALHKSKILGQKRGIDFLHLPQYRVPDWRNLAIYVWNRINAFLKKAGKIIFTMSVVLWVLLSFPRDKEFEQSVEQAKNTDQPVAESLIASKRLENSFAGRTGKFLEPLFRPIGLDWKLSIGVLGSLAAREVFVSTLGTVFSLGNVDENSSSLSDTLRDEKDSSGTPKYNLATCLSLLLFFAFSLQCISTIGVAKRESNSWKIPAFMFFYMFALAYVSAFLVYQVASKFLV